MLHKGIWMQESWKMYCRDQLWPLTARAMAKRAEQLCKSQRPSCLGYSEGSYHFRQKQVIVQCGEVFLWREILGAPKQWRELLRTAIARQQSLTREARPRRDHMEDVKCEAKEKEQKGIMNSFWNRKLGRGAAVGMVCPSRKVYFIPDLVFNCQSTEIIKSRLTFSLFYHYF